MVQILSKNSYIEQLNISQTDQDSLSIMYIITILNSNQENANINLKVIDLSRPILEYQFQLNTSDLANNIGLMLRVSILNIILIKLH